MFTRRKSVEEKKKRRRKKGEKEIEEAMEKRRKWRDPSPPPPPPPTRFSVKRCYCTRVLTRDKIRIAKKYIRSLCELRLRLFARKRRKISDIDTPAVVYDVHSFYSYTFQSFYSQQSFFYVIIMGRWNERFVRWNEVNSVRRNRIGELVVK